MGNQTKCENATWDLLLETSKGKSFKVGEMLTIVAKYTILRNKKVRITKHKRNQKTSE